MGLKRHDYEWKGTDGKWHSFEDEHHFDTAHDCNVTMRRKLTHKLLAKIAVELGCFYILRHDTKDARRLARQHSTVKLVVRDRAAARYVTINAYYSRKRSEWRCRDVGSQAGRAVTGEIVGVAVWSA